MRIDPAIIAKAESEGRVTWHEPAKLPIEPVVSLETRMAWSEKYFQAEVVKLAEMIGWLCYHPWLSIRSAKGFPDLVMVRGIVVFAELKKQKGKEKGEQKYWRERLKRAGQHCYLWRPSDWEEIVATLA